MNGAGNVIENAFEHACDTVVDGRAAGTVAVQVTSAKHPGMVAIIDAADAPRVAGKRWNWSPGKPDRPMQGSVVLAMNGSPKPSLGRIILGITDPDLLVSHLNGDRLDFRRANLIARSRSDVAKAKKPSSKTIEALRPYPDPDRPGVWRVPLKGYLTRREALIDAVDLPMVTGKRWNWSPNKEGRVEGTVVLATTGRQIPLSRVLLNLSDGRDRVHHLNGDPLDCRRENLKILNQTELNCRSAKMGTVNGREYTSRFKGVSWDKDRERWLVQIRKEGVYRHLGRYHDELNAAERYDEAARELFGEHARLNFPDGIDARLEEEARTIPSNDRAAA